MSELDPRSYPQLAFAVAPPTVHEDESGRLVLRDPLRERLLRLTPEEWVRQQLVAELLQRGFPRGRFGLEWARNQGRTQGRADVVVLAESGRPELIAECKAATVALAPAHLAQLTRYARVDPPRWLLLTNGLQHRCLELAASGDEYLARAELPMPNATAR
ncbi:MAG: type I restriction enzyme HsdR N-terminal domain-containing protein [Acidobacteriota bacterium]